MTHIDTAAEMYGNGKAEELVGQDIASRKRKDIFLDSIRYCQQNKGLEVVPIAVLLFSRVRFN